MLICFVQHSTAGFIVRSIAAWLSKNSGIGPLIGNPISLLKDLSHAACCPVLANSIYSAFPTDNVTFFCRWDAQDIAPFAIKKMCPDVEWWWNSRMCTEGPLFVHVSTWLSTWFERNLNLWSKPNREWDQFYWSNDHLCFHPNLSLSIWLTQHWKLYHIWSWAPLYLWGI